MGVSGQMFSPSRRALTDTEHNFLLRISDSPSLKFKEARSTLETLCDLVFFKNQRLPKSADGHVLSFHVKAFV